MGLTGTLRRGCYLALVFLYIAGIPKLGPIPVSLKYLFLLGAILLSLPGDAKGPAAAVRAVPRPVWGFLATVVAVSILTGRFAPAVAPVESLLFLLATFLVCRRDEGMHRRTVRTLAFVLALSGAWYLASIFQYGRMMPVREFLYAANVDPNDSLTSLAMARPTGLTFGHHTMGYQMAAAVVIVGMLALTEDRLRARVAWGAAFVVTFAALVLTAQRSTIPAIAAAAICLLATRYRRKALYLVGGIAALVAVAFATVEMLDLSEFEGLGLRSLMARAEEADTGSRLGWQAVAARLILDSPAGFLLEGRSWEVEAPAMGADFSDFGGDDTPFVHNSYLATVLQYGWISAVFVALVLWVAWGRIVRALRAPPSDGPRCRDAVILAAALVALLLQALFHNAGIFKNEPTSWTVFALLLSAGGSKGKDSGGSGVSPPVLPAA